MRAKASVGGVEVHRGALLYALRPEATVNSTVINPNFPDIQRHEVNGEVWSLEFLIIMPH